MIFTHHRTTFGELGKVCAVLGREEDHTYLYIMILE